MLFFKTVASKTLTVTLGLVFTIRDMRVELRQDMSASVGVCSIHTNMVLTLEDKIIAETQMAPQNHGAIL